MKLNMISCDCAQVDGKAVINTTLKKSIEALCSTHKVSQSSISLALGMDKSIVNKYINHTDKNMPGMKPFINLCAIFNITNLTDISPRLGYVINSEANRKLIELQLQSTEYTNLLADMAIRLKNSHEATKNLSTIDSISSFALFNGEVALRPQVKSKMNIWLEMNYDDVIRILRCTHTELSSYINQHNIVLIESRGKHSFLVKCGTQPEDFKNETQH